MRPNCSNIILNSDRLINYQGNCCLYSSELNSGVQNRDKTRKRFKACVKTNATLASITPTSKGDEVTPNVDQELTPQPPPSTPDLN